MLQESQRKIESKHRKFFSGELNIDCSLCVFGCPTIFPHMLMQATQSLVGRRSKLSNSALQVNCNLHMIHHFLFKSS